MFLLPTNKADGMQALGETSPRHGLRARPVMRQTAATIDMARTLLKGGWKVQLLRDRLLGMSGPRPQGPPAEWLVTEARMPFAAKKAIATEMRRSVRRYQDPGRNEASLVSM